MEGLTERAQEIASLADTLDRLRSPEGVKWLQGEVDRGSPTALALASLHAHLEALFGTIGE